MDFYTWLLSVLTVTIGAIAGNYFNGMTIWLIVLILSVLVSIVFFQGYKIGLGCFVEDYLAHILNFIIAMVVVWYITSDQRLLTDILSIFIRSN